jgi:hypothetical protein
MSQEGEGEKLVQGCGAEGDESIADRIQNDVLSVPA